MGHLSIAVIKKVTGTTTQGDPAYEFLVIKKGDEFRFYDAKSLAIGSSFNFSGFQKKIIDALGLPDTSFEKITPLRTSRKDDATAYEYLLSNKQTEFVDQKISEGGGLYDKFLWLTEEGLIASKIKWNTGQSFIFAVEKPFSKSTFSKTLRTSIKNIVKARANGKLVIFAGAGVSIDSNVPGWGKLIAGLKADIECGDVDYLQVGELYSQQRGNKEYQERVREILNAGSTIYNPIHKKILEIRPIHVITTNFDSHFEQIIESKNFHYSVIKKDTDLPYSKGNSLFIKMHGDFFEKNIVLKDSDYKKYSETFPLIESYIKGLFASKLVLFVGFSFTDPNLIQILKSVKDLLGDDNQLPYLFRAETESITADQREFVESQVRVTDYEDDAIHAYFEQVSTPEEKDNLEKLSPHGGHTYKFLKVVESFDLVADAIERMDIQDQLKHSLDRFKGLSSIPPTCFELLSPFTLKKKSVFDFSNKAAYSSAYSFHLETLNEDLLNLLESKKENGEIHFSPYRDKGSKHREFDQILKFLYASGVECIIRKGDTSPSHNKLVPEKNKEECLCFRCLYNNFKFSALLSDLDSTVEKLMCQNDSEGGSLLEAYGFFKTVQPSKAFYALEKLKNEAWKIQNYTVYFLASYNQWQLLPFLYWYYDSQIKEEEFEQIKLKIKQLSLDRLLLDLPVDEEVRAVLKYIADNKISNSAEEVIKANLVKVREVYNGYSSGSGYFRMSGPMYWHIIQTEFFILSNFYRSNFMYNDEFDYFKRLANLYIESVIISVATPDEYEQHIGFCSRFFFDTFISHGKPEDNAVLLDQYQIQGFKFSEDDKCRQHILKMFNNCLDSGYVQQNFLGESIERNEVLGRAFSRSDYMKRRVKRILDNFFILLTQIDLQEEELNLLIVKTINYLQVSTTYNGHNDFQFFEKFIIHYVSKISSPNVLNLIDFSLSDNIWSGKLIGHIAPALIKTGHQGILGDKVYTKIVRRSEYRKNWTVGIEEMIPLHQLLKDEQQEQFRSHLAEKLAQGKLNTDYIRKAYNCKVWTTAKGDPFYNFFCDLVTLNISKIPDFTFDDRGRPSGLSGAVISNETFFAVTLIYSNDLLGTDFCKRLNENAVSKAFKWILSPDTFNYDHFDIRWVLLFNKRTILSRLTSNDNLKQAIVRGLTEKFNEKIARIYFEVLNGTGELTELA